MWNSHCGLTVVVLLLVTYAHKCHGGKNVLFLVADDLRPELNVYYEAGSQLHPDMYTPNIDALAGRSLLLKKAHCQFPVCTPSRASFMTGRRPDTTLTYQLTTYWRDVAGDFETIPEHFKNNGYRTAGTGKIFHPGQASGGNNDKQSWTDPYFNGVNNFESKKKSWQGIKDKKLKKTKLADEQVADHAINKLRQFAPNAKDGTEPFFLAVGFKKPHLPFVFPKSLLKKRYKKKKIEPPSNPYVEDGLPDIAWFGWGELRAYTDIEKLGVTGVINETLPDKKVQDLRRAYYAAVTWMDEQLGRVVDELDALGLTNNTIISFVGDHGFLLGEHGSWCKYVLFELANHVPMMLHIPGLTDGGVVSNQLAELVDLFPTITEAAGLAPIGRCPENSTLVKTCTEGISLLSLATDPDTALRNASFTQQPRWKSMGYTIRTHDFRYTEWVAFDSETSKPDWTVVKGRELYDVNLDQAENKNIVDDPNYDGHVTVLKNALRSGWRNAIL